ncbi:hypothetical protein [Humidesulfovibrio sp.]
MAGSSKQAGPTKAKASGAKASQAAGAVEGSAMAKADSAPHRVKSKALCLNLGQKRKLAKDAMVASLAVLTVTAFTGVRRRGPSRSLHIASGAALIGLALWHHNLYGASKAAQCPAPAL